MYFNNKNFDDDKNFPFIFCESNRNFITEHVKLLKFNVFPGFFLPKLSNYRFFQDSRLSDNPENKQ